MAETVLGKGVFQGGNNGVLTEDIGEPFRAPFSGDGLVLGHDLRLAPKGDVCNWVSTGV